MRARFNRFCRLLAESWRLIAERRDERAEAKPMSYQQSFFTLN